MKILELGNEAYAWYSTTRVFGGRKSDTEWEKCIYKGLQHVGFRIPYGMVFDYHSYKKQKLGVFHYGIRIPHMVFNYWTKNNNKSEIHDFGIRIPICGIRIPPIESWKFSWFLNILA